MLVAAVSVPATGAPPVDLGGAAANGDDAVATIPMRSETAIVADACGDEIGFLNATLADPDHRPTNQLISKTAFIVRHQGDEGGVVCRASLPFFVGEWASHFTNDDTVDPAWVDIDGRINRLNDALNKTPPGVTESEAITQKDQLRDLVATAINPVLARYFGPTCNSVLENVRSDFITVDDKRFVAIGLDFALPGDCLLSQINSVLLDRTLNRGGNNPGTNGLPCGLFVAKAAHGDWDMAVTTFTRLTMLLGQVVPDRANIDDTADSLVKLNHRLLTLSGGAAAESYPLWTCGNGDNSYGSADDRLNDDGFFDEDLGEAVDSDGEGDAGGWEFLAFLALLLLLIIAVAIASAIVAAAVATLDPVIVIAGAVVAVVLGAIPLIVGAFIGGIEETENHLLMQNSAKYLKNKLLIAEALSNGNKDGADEFRDDNKDIRSWFFDRLERIADEDFAEYNSRPYGRLSTFALLNIHDFACTAEGIDESGRCPAADEKLVKATAAVLDLLAAKMALGSNQGRRVVPFRRLATTNTSHDIGGLQNDKVTRNPPQHVMDMGGGADHMIAATQLWTGQTSHGLDQRAGRGSLGEMIWHATSDYRPHAMILDIAADKSLPFEQIISNGKNGGWERYSSGPGWLLTAGGTTSGFAQGFTSPVGTIYPWIIKDNDRGVGVPTTLMALTQRPMVMMGEPPPFVRQDLYSDLLRFEGSRKTWPRDDKDEPLSHENNLCLHKSFACGTGMVVPAVIESCITPVQNMPANLFFIESDTCPAYDDQRASNDFLVVGYRQNCSCPGGSWGFIEIYERGYYEDLFGFAALLVQRNDDLFDKLAAADGKSPVKYHSLQYGTIEFDPEPSGTSTGVLKIDAQDVPDNDYDDWPRARGGVINQVGDGAHFTITNPRTQQQIEIDLTEEEDPKRVLPN